MLRIQDFKILPDLSSSPLQGAALMLIAGDASDRKFFRLLNDSQNAICMQFPKWEGGYGGDPISWIGMHEALSKMGLPLPKIIEIDETQCCIWTEDLGDCFLNSAVGHGFLDVKNPNCEAGILMYKQALSLLVQMQYSSVKIDHPALNRFFDFEKLFFELNFFVTHFLNGFLGLNVSEKESKTQGLFQDLKLLAKKLDSYEKVLCHRDYHVRNLMLKEGKLYWIDFQDARMGPHSYDVVSLVRDSYVKITWDTRHELFSYYLQELNFARSRQNLSGLSQSGFHLELLLMGLQRNLKAIGSFGYLATKKGKPSYLHYVQHTLQLLSAPQAQYHEEMDLKHLMPHLFALIENLTHGELSLKLNELICKNF